MHDNFHSGYGTYVYVSYFLQSSNTMWIICFLLCYLAVLVGDCDSCDSTGHLSPCPYNLDHKSINMLFWCALQDWICVLLYIFIDVSSRNHQIFPWYLHVLEWNTGFFCFFWLFLVAAFVRGVPQLVHLLYIYVCGIHYHEKNSLLVILCMYLPEKLCYFLSFQVELIFRILLKAKSTVWSVIGFIYMEQYWGQFDILSLDPLALLMVLMFHTPDTSSS